MNDGSFFQRPAPEAVEPPCPPPGGMKEPDAEWLGMLHQLACFQMQHGHCDVNRHARRHPKLALWLRRQMDLHAKGRLPVTQSRELEVLGVDWEAAALLVKRKPRSDARWQERLAELAAFKEKHGHLRVTLKNQLSPGMMHWRDNQRIRLSQGVMPPEQKARLDALGFEWECPGRISPMKEVHFEARWEQMFEKLLAWRAEHGHCQAPKARGEDPALGKWVQRQREHYRKNMLPPERRRRLEEIGFAWKSDRLHFAQGWDGRFAELAAFNEKHGHMRVTLRNQLSPGMMHWRDNQRIRLRAGVMKPDQKARLDALGFEWECPGRISPIKDEHFEARWEQMFEKLLAWRAKHDHCQVPKARGEDPALGKWVQRQREHHRKNMLPPERRRRLEEIGFAWKSEKLHFTQGWDARFAELAAFKERHGHLRVTIASQTSAGLAHWRDYQRIRLRNGAMPPEQKARLDALGFEWEAPASALRTRPVWAAPSAVWEERLAELAAFKDKHGHFRVPKHKAEHKTLHSWVKAQRVYRRKGSLRQEHGEKLDALGFPWNPGSAGNGAPLRNSSVWEERRAELAAFKDKHGHFRVPKHKAEYKTLHSWVKAQRVYRRKGSLRQEHGEKLDALGFPWNPGSAGNDAPRRNSSVWEERFAELAAFKDKHGHFRVPKHKAEHKTLHSWVVAQRVYRRKGSLRQEHEEKLDTLGFPWNPGGDADLRKKISGSQWEANFQELLDFKERHGHTRVSHREEPQKQLYGWLARQRQAFRRGSLPPLHRQLLEQAGVEWHPGKIRHDGRTSFDERLEELRAFRARHGHANVPTKYPPNPLLGNWVSNTRVYRKNGRLSARQIQELDELGFPWRGDHNNNAAHADSWERRFASLVKYHENHGHANIPSTDKEHASLAGWLTSQRVSHRKGKLTEERTRKLESLGIRWGKAVYQKGLSRTWDQRLEELAAFRRQHGHPHVSKADKAHRSLEIWTKMQRVAYHKGRLSADQVRRLEALGFRWIGTEAFWERQFRRWQAATQRRRTRHLTPAGDGDDDLVKWEQTQRTLHRQGRLAPARAELLTRAGMILEPA